MGPKQTRRSWVPTELAGMLVLTGAHTGRRASTQNIMCLVKGLIFKMLSVLKVWK